jgi:uncharacterized cupredoxin-like copper-binding protein
LSPEGRILFGLPGLLRHRGPVAIGCLRRRSRQVHYEISDHDDKTPRVGDLDDVRPMRMRFLSLVILIGLAGCTGGDVLLSEPPPDYLQDAGARVAAADWSETEKVMLELSEFRFEPAALVFREGVPTALTLRNLGDRTHTFRSVGFFKAIAAQKLVSADGEIADPYPETIEVPAGETKQLHFVPVTKGSYPLECSIPLHAVFGMEGQITIE